MAIHDASEYLPVPADDGDAIDDRRDETEDELEDGGISDKGLRLEARLSHEDLMHRVWQVDVSSGRCVTGYPEWRDGLPGEAWARALRRSEDEEARWTPR